MQSPVSFKSRSSSYSAFCLKPLQTGNCKENQRLLNIVMQLRKAANHPYLFEGQEDRTLDEFGDHIITNSGLSISVYHFIALINFDPIQARW